MFSLFELVWKRIRLFFTDDEVFYIGGADVLPPPLLSYRFKRAAWGQ